MNKKIAIIYASILFISRIIIFIAVVLACWYIGGKTCGNGHWLRGVGMILVVPGILIYSLNFAYALLLMPALPFLEDNSEPQL